MNLLIKGTPAQAREAAEARGIRLQSCELVNRESIYKECTATVEETYRVEVIRWFCEPGPTSGPNPPGTLLHHD